VRGVFSNESLTSPEAAHRSQSGGERKLCRAGSDAVDALICLGTQPYGSRALCRICSGTQPDSLRALSRCHALTCSLGLCRLRATMRRLAEACLQRPALLNAPLAEASLASVGKPLQA
jgi:hypothetical protein